MEKRSVVFGRQRGNGKPAEYEQGTNEGGTMFKHDQETWGKNVVGCQEKYGEALDCYREFRKRSA